MVMTWYWWYIIIFNLLYLILFRLQVWGCECWQWLQGQQCFLVKPFDGISMSIKIVIGKYCHYDHHCEGLHEVAHPKHHQRWLHGVPLRCQKLSRRLWWIYNVIRLEENISNFAWINLLCRGVPTNTFNDNCGDNHRTRDNHPEETEDERFDWNDNKQWWNTTITITRGWEVWLKWQQAKMKHSCD